MERQQQDPEYTLEDALDATIEVRGSALEALHGADLERQADAAKRHPRGIRAFRDRLHEYATLDEHTAGSCIYSIPRGGKRITGPSVRFAEIVQAAWGNLHVTCTLISVDGQAAIVRGRCLDLESNSSLEIDVRRRVTKKKSKNAPDDDDKQLAVAVATSLARRNVILAVVPRSLWESGYHAAGQAATGKGTMEARRQAALSLYAELGATEEQVLAHLEREGVEEITQDDLRHLRGMVTAIRSGELTLAKALQPPEQQKPMGPAGVAGEGALAAKLAAAAGGEP
jgi:hypothetical protein